jgi:hypothetical protein
MSRGLHLFRPRDLVKAVEALMAAGTRGRYPLYHPDDFDGWVGGKLSNLVTSTSELIKKAESIESAPVNTGSAPKANAGRASNPDSEDGSFVGSMMRPARRRNANAR